MDKIQNYMQQFQSTLPRRERHYWKKQYRKMKTFQSTLPRRERPCKNAFVFGLDKFQSTLPRRERQLWRVRLTIQYDFNPRSREGSDLMCPAIRFSRSISIHAPAKGATARCIRRLVLRQFQSTLPRRERQVRTLKTFLHGAISIHAPAKGATSKLQENRSIAGYISIHAPAKGATMEVGKGKNDGKISIHAPAKGATCYRLAAF